MDDGTGLVGVIPPLAGSEYLRDNLEKLPCIIRKGIKGELKTNKWEYQGVMPGVPQLTEFEITNIINYINTAWGNDYPLIKHEIVRNALAQCP
jgi:mono/diheme cytochrome c family protein